MPDFCRGECGDCHFDASPPAHVLSAWRTPQEQAQHEELQRCLQDSFQAFWQVKHCPPILSLDLTLQLGSLNAALVDWLREPLQLSWLPLSQLRALSVMDRPFPDVLCELRYMISCKHWRERASMGRPGCLLQLVNSCTNLMELGITFCIGALHQLVKLLPAHLPASLEHLELRSLTMQLDMSWTRRLMAAVASLTLQAPTIILGQCAAERLPRTAHLQADTFYLCDRSRHERSPSGT